MTALTDQTAQLVQTNMYDEFGIIAESSGFTGSAVGVWDEEGGDEFVHVAGVGAEVEVGDPVGERADLILRVATQEEEIRAP